MIVWLSSDFVSSMEFPRSELNSSFTLLISSDKSFLTSLIVLFRFSSIEETEVSSSALAPAISSSSSDLAAAMSFESDWLADNMFSEIALFNSSLKLLMDVLSVPILLLIRHFLHLHF